MLRCLPIDVRCLTEQQLRCGPCQICAARSRLDYPFDRDLKNSDELVIALEAFIEDNTPFRCERTTIHKNPDVVVIQGDDRKTMVCRVEAKMLEGFAFMKAESILPDKLKPKETLVVDLPKLLHYFDCMDADFRESGRKIPVFLVWKFDRPCRDIGGITVFQDLHELRKIYESRGLGRYFGRAVTPSDIRDGVKMGITDKYHFSLRECRPIDELIPAILSALPHASWPNPDFNGKHHKPDRHSGHPLANRSACTGGT